MNYNAAKAMLPLFQDVWEYFGCDGYGTSNYKEKQPFCPGAGPLSITAPKQLVYSARQDGVFIQMDGMGGPDLKREVIAMLDGIPYLDMVSAVEYVKYRDHARRTEYCRTLLAVSLRSVSATKTEVAEALNLSRVALDDRLGTACVLLWEHLDVWLDLEVNRRYKVN